MHVSEVHREFPISVVDKTVSATVEDVESPRVGKRDILRAKLSHEEM